MASDKLSPLKSEKSGEPSDITKICLFLLSLQLRSICMYVSKYAGNFAFNNIHHLGIYLLTQYVLKTSLTFLCNATSCS